MEKLNFKDGYLKKFVVIPDQTLFPPNWSALKDKRCPLCGNKLRLPQQNNMAICNNPKKHAKPFVIHRNKL